MGRNKQYDYAFSATSNRGEKFCGSRLHNIKNIMSVFFFCSISSIGNLVYAHHGGVSTAFGPGAPVETASPMTIGKRKFLLYEKMEFASFGQESHADPENIENFTFFNTLVGYGITDYLSLYLVIPYAIKEQDSLGTSKGFGDAGFLAQYGFKYGERNGIRGFYHNGPEDTIGESYTTNDLKMSFLGGFTVQTGDITNEDNKGNRFDMGMQTGFAAPTFMTGFSASKSFSLILPLQEILHLPRLPVTTKENRAMRYVLIWQEDMKYLKILRDFSKGWILLRNQISSI